MTYLGVVKRIEILSFAGYRLWFTTGNAHYTTSEQTSRITEGMRLWITPHGTFLTDV